MQQLNTVKNVVMAKLINKIKPPIQNTKTVETIQNKLPFEVYIPITTTENNSLDIDKYYEEQEKSIERQIILQYNALLVKQIKASMLEQLFITEQAIGIEKNQIERLDIILESTRRKQGNKKQTLIHRNKAGKSMEMQTENQRSKLKLNKQIIQYKYQKSSLQFIQTVKDVKNVSFNKYKKKFNKHKSKNKANLMNCYKKLESEKKIYNSLKKGQNNYQQMFNAKLRIKLLIQEFWILTQSQNSI